MKSSPFLSCGLLVPALGFLCSPVRAGSLDNAVIALHARPAAQTKYHCPSSVGPSSDPNSEGIPCTDYTVTAPIFVGTRVYLVVGQGGETGITGISFGLDYKPGSGPGNGIDEESVMWTPCGDTEFSSNNWPKRHSGNIIGWATCQTQQIGSAGVHAVAGAFYMYAYSEDVLRVVTPFPYTDIPGAIASCDGETVQPWRITDPELWDTLAGRVHFGGDGSQGYTPCGVTPVRSTTWGRIKSTYE